MRSFKRIIYSLIHYFGRKFMFECPICHQNNHCGVNQPSQCWCMNTDITAEMSLLFADKKSNKLCFCIQCVTIFKKNPEIIHALLKEKSTTQKV